MKIGVIGVGAMGKNHVRIYNELNVLGAICDPDLKTTSILSKTYNNCLSYNSVDQLLKNCELDAVSIATPTESHVETAMKCLDYNLHVLCEKPISNDLESAKKLAAYAESKKRILAIGYIERYNPAFQALLKLIQGGTFGEITSINIKRIGGEPRSATNVILDLMTHDLNLLITLFKQYPNSITTHKKNNNGIVDSAQVLLSFGNASATCEANWISPVKVRQIHITGTKGYAEVDMLSQKITLFNPNVPPSNSSFYQFLLHYSLPSSTTTSVFSKEPLKEEISAFINAIKTNNSDNLILAKDAVQTLQLTLESNS